MINLPNLKILDMKESEYDYRFLVESTDLFPSHYPKCGTVANLYKHGKITVFFRRKEKITFLTFISKSYKV